MIQKDFYESLANQIPNWKTMSKNELCFKYIEESSKQNKISDSYLAALICKYLPKVDKYYYLNIKSATLEECYDWLIDAILYVLNHQRWNDKDSSIYQDKNAPDKMINRCLQSNRLIHYQASNRYKRKLNYTLNSLDEIKEEYNIDIDNKQDSFLDLDKQIIKFFREKEYFAAFVLDGILNNDSFDIINNNKVFSRKKLAKHIRHLDDEYCEVFAELYDLDVEKVKHAALYCNKLNTEKIYKKLDSLFNYLKRIIKTGDFESI